MENYYTHHSGKYGGYRQQLTKATNIIMLESKSSWKKLVHFGRHCHVQPTEMTS